MDVGTTKSRYSMIAIVGTTIEHVHRSTHARIRIKITDVDFDEFHRLPYANKITPLPSVPIIATRMRYINRK